MFLLACLKADTPIMRGNFGFPRFLADGNFSVAIIFFIAFLGIVFILKS
jgi:hypothetical protein